MKRILVVEDNEANMYLIGFILRKNGYEVLEAWNGEEGIELAVKERPDLVIMDIRLPDMDGLDAVRRVRRSGDNANITIVALTSYAMKGDREKALEAGCTGYIEKPIDPESIIAELERYLE